MLDPNIQVLLDSGKLEEAARLAEELDQVITHQEWLNAMRGLIPKGEVRQILWATARTGVKLTFAELADLQAVFIRKHVAALARNEEPWSGELLALTKELDVALRRWAKDCDDLYKTRLAAIEALEGCLNNE